VRPIEVLHAWSKAFIARDIDALMELYADDAINHQTPEEPVIGKAAIRENHSNFFKYFPDEQTEAIHFLESSDWAIWEWKGWSPMDPEKTIIHGCGFFQVRDGKIVLQRGYWDKIAFLKAHNLK
jgi:ketosteroid isomerase-like protein